MEFWKGIHAFPLYGAAVVFRRERRGRRLWRDALALSAFLAGLVGLSAILQFLVFDRVIDCTLDAGAFIRQWITPTAMAATLLLMGSAAVLGSAAAPTRDAEHEIQAVILADLTTFDLCTGRLVAALWMPLAVVAASCLCWMIARTRLNDVTAVQGGSGAILTAHVVLVCAVMMVGEVSLLCGLCRRPGRAWGRGAAAGLVLTLFCVAGLFLMTPRIHSLDDPSRLIEVALLINPVSAVETALHRDILRSEWVYAHTDAADYPFNYPAPLASAGIYATVGLIAHTLAAIRLRRAYR